MDERDHAPTDIAIIALAGRFPGADSTEQLWQNLRDGVESISFFSPTELLAAGVEQTLLDNPAYVPARGLIPDAELFDAAFFGYSPQEAALIEPQQRLFLECAWETLERAGYNPDRYSGKIGVFAGVGVNTYLLSNLMQAQSLLGSVGLFQLTMSNDKDFLPTRVSYQLNLTGPSISVNTACSTSLVAVVLAVQSLLLYQSDIALAGGVSIRFPQRSGYLYQPDGILSPDGHCRAFDAAAQGTVGGDGVGLVALKRLDDALADGDQIYAVIKGAAINNDGAHKVGYTAPSVSGQAAVIAEALALADIDPATIGYIETHGTGTALGDPIELAALRQVFRTHTSQVGSCAIGSLKTNIGHLDSAAGVAGLIKAVLALQHRQIPPSLHYTSPNPRLELEQSPFYVNTQLRAWPERGTPPRAAVSAFGIGGTNAHVILQADPPQPVSPPGLPWQLLVLSARTPAALEQASDRLAATLEQRPALELADLAYTLQVGRKTFEQRRFLVCDSPAAAQQALASHDGHLLHSGAGELRERPVLFMFPGGGAQYIDMGQGLYAHVPVFRQHVDACLELLQARQGLDLRGLLFPAPAERAQAATQISRPSVGLPLLFLIEYALAQLWMAWGVRPAALIGHSLGEYAAACLAGVITLEDALALVALRGRLFEQLPDGAMLSVSLPEAQVVPLLGDQLAIAAINAPDLCVVSGPRAAVAALEQQLNAAGVHCVAVRIAVAAHSPMVEPILAEFGRFVAQIPLRPPQLPYLSNVTGSWVTPQQATDPAYWVAHLRQTVYFAAGLQEAARDPSWLLLEVGPGRTLSALAQRQPWEQAPLALESLRHPHDRQSDLAFALTTLGRLWLAGLPIDWQGLWEGQPRRRVVLPTYPFERRRYTLGGPSASEAPAAQAMPAPMRYERPAISQHYLAPRSPLEQQLAEIWQALLGIDRVGVEDSFFELGGQSLLATQIMARVRASFQVDLSIGALFEAPSVAGLAEQIERCRAESSSSAAAIPAGHPADQPAPLSFAQQRLWFLEQLEPGQPIYNVPLAVRISGALDVARLERSLHAIISRHAVLRTDFGADDGRPFQRIQPAMPLALPISDLSALERAAQEAELRRQAAQQARQPFVLSQAPLLRARLLRLSDNEHVALLTIHHIVFDGWSMGILLREIAALYAAEAAGQPSPLPELPIQYADFSIWQRNWQASQVYPRQLAYWQERLRGLPAALELPTDHPRPQTQTFRGAWQYGALTPELSQQLAALGQAEGITLFMLLLAAFQVLLARYTGQTDIVVGTPIAGRTQAELEGLIGFFVNTLALRSELGDNPSFRQLARRVRANTLADFANQELPFEQLVEALDLPRDLSRPPLFQVMFAFENTPRETLTLPGLSMQLIDTDSGTAKFDLTMFMEEAPQGLVVALEYNADLFDPATITRMLGHWQTLLAGIVAQPDAPIGTLPLLTQAEQAQLHAWASPGAAPAAPLVHELFAAHARRQPTAPALVGQPPNQPGATRQLSYAALDRRANHLARLLRQRGVGPETFVGICMPRSVELVVAILAIYKAGGAYVPLDPAYPRERLALMLADSGAPLVLTHGGAPATLAGPLPQITLEQRDDGWWVAGQLVDEAALPAQAPSGAVQPDHPAYLIYTSGSTGGPKGVIVPHRQLASYVGSVTERLGLESCASFALLSTFGADLGHTVLFPALASGGCLHVLAEEYTTDPQALAAYLGDHPIDCYKIVPAHLAALLDSPYAAALLPRRLVLGGEASDWGLIARITALRPDCQVFNHYGPTETTVGVITYAATPVPAQPVAGRQRVPLGRPLAGSQVYLLDRWHNPVPLGVPGELYVGGAQVTRGYLGRPELTAERFVPNPFAASQHHAASHTSAASHDEAWVVQHEAHEGHEEHEGFVGFEDSPNQDHAALIHQPASDRHAAKPTSHTPQASSLWHGLRLYRTGDLARWLPEGVIEFLGRIDGQIKLRGFRIELGEIEATLRSHPAVSQAAVLVREDDPGTRRLVGYLVPAQSGDGQAADADQITSWLAERLPAHMVPAALVTLAALPRTPNGKLDWRALPPPQIVTADTQALDGNPRTPAEATLCGIWRDVLRRPQVGIHDDFFALGGDSILSIQIIARANQAGLRLTPRQIFQHHTIAELAALAGAAAAPASAQEPLVGPLPLLPVQQRFFAQQLAEAHHWHQALLLATHTPLDRELLERAFAVLLLHHDGLRLRFAAGASGWLQRYEAPGELVECQQIDLADTPEPQQLAAIHAATSALLASMRFEQGPLLRLALLRRGPGRSDRLFIAIHHLLTDGVSWRVLLEDLQTAYGQLARGEAIQLPPKTSAYRQWGEQLIDYASSAACMAELAYWTAPRRALVAPLPTDMPPAHNTVGSARTLSVTLTPEETQLLLHELPTSYRTQINEVLLAALGAAYARWSGQRQLLIDLEGHGREDLFATIDLSRTVGWFTSVFPLLLELGDTPQLPSAPTLIAQVKEQLRAVPARGIGYGVLRYLHPDEHIRTQLAALPPAQLIFNYLGQLDQPLADSALLTPAPEPIGPTRSPRGQRRYLIDVNALVSQGRLQIDWTYGPHIHQPATIEQLAQGFLAELRALISQRAAPDNSGYTPSDFPEADLSPTALERLMSRISRRETRR